MPPCFAVAQQLREGCAPGVNALSIRAVTVSPTFICKRRGKPELETISAHRATEAITLLYRRELEQFLSVSLCRMQFAKRVSGKGMTEIQAGKNVQASHRNFRNDLLKKV